MENEYYYRQNLQNAMNDWLLQETDDDQHELGWIPDELHKRMADAAFAVLIQNIETQEWMEKETLSNPLTN
jgi:hypothetical protein